MGELELKVETIDDEPVSKLPMAREKFSLYLRAPGWIKDREKSAAQVKKLNKRIIEVRFPRQKSAHYCYIDFNSAEDRDKAVKELQKIVKEKKIVVMPVTKDKPNLLEKRIEAVQKKRTIKREVTTLLKSVAEQDALQVAAKRNSNLSSKVSIINVPRTVTIDDIKNEFSKAIGVTLNFPPNKSEPGNALLTFATSKLAFQNAKRMVIVSGTELKLRIELNKVETKAAMRRKKGQRQLSIVPKMELVKKEKTEEKTEKSENPKKFEKPKKLKTLKNSEQTEKKRKSAAKSKKIKRGAKNNEEIKIYN